MSNEVTAKNDSAVEKVMLQGDLSQLTPAERVNYYTRLCNYLGLNPVTQPFKILRLQGRDVLYATKDATEQLRKMNGVSIDKKESETVADVYVVTVYGHDGSGRTDMATGAVTIGDAKGDKLANLLMKAETKAKRRFTLSICGLGVLDETEIETIPGEKEVKPLDAGPTEEDSEQADSLCKELKRELENAKLDELITPEEYAKAAAGVEKRCSDWETLTEYAKKLRARLAEVWKDNEKTEPQEKVVSEPKQQEMIEDAKFPIF